MTTTMVFNPYDWYWIADDARVFSSAREVIVGASDPDYVAWSGSHAATTWPRDGAGNQTTASLQVVLTPYGIWGDLKAYAADARSRRAGGGVIITSLSPIAFISEPVARNTLANAYEYIKSTPGNTVNWKLSDGSFIVLTESQLQKAVTAVATFVQSCFTKESEIVAGIAGGTITTLAQIDAAFASISNVFP